MNRQTAAAIAYMTLLRQRGNSTPVNTMQPGIAGSTFVIDTEIEGVAGEWTGNPTITHQWYWSLTNTNSGGTAITGATSLNYTPVTEDDVFGKYLYRAEIPNGNAAAAVASAAVGPVAGAVVADPTGWTWDVPFDVRKGGSTYYVDESFDLETYAAITVAKTYYVATDGNDANSGLTAALPLRRVRVALSKADADCVMVKAGTYSYDYGWKTVSPARSMKVIGYDGAVILSQHVEGLSWSAVDNHYEASQTVGIGSVVDASVPDADGDYIPLTYRTSAALVDANPGSWYYDATADIIYVRTTDSRQPDSNVYCFIGDTNQRQDDAVTYYVEGIEFWGGSNNVGLLSSANAGAKFYAKNCAWKYNGNAAQQDGLFVSGMGEVILQNSVAARNSGDGFKVDANTGQIANLAMIDCIGRYNGLAASTNANGYSRHVSGNTIAVGCKFYGNKGPNVADIGASRTWMLGVECRDALSTRANWQTQNTTVMWLDGCVSDGGGTADLFADTGSTINYRNMTPATPTTSGGGTIQTY